MLWTDEMVDGLRQMWEEGLTANEIAKRLNVSKNSIVGKVHRLCLKARPSPIKKKDEENSETYDIEESETIEVVDGNIGVAETQTLVAEEVIVSESAKKSKSLEKAKTEELKNNKSVTSENLPQKSVAKSPKNLEGQQNIKLVQLDSHTCRWPLGDPRDDDFCFCGKKVRMGQTYCDEHSAVAYVKAIRK